MTSIIKEKLLGLPRRYKRLLQVFADVVLIWLSVWLAFVFRVGYESSCVAVQAHSWLLWSAPLITIPTSVKFGMYRAVMRFLGKEALLEIAKSINVYALVLGLAVYCFCSYC